MHLFNPDHAKAYGIVEAVLINHFQFWLKKNKANGHNIIDGKVWTYNSYDALSKLFSYLNERKIKYSIKKLVDLNVLEKGKFNENSYDRTNWYCFVDEEKFLGNDTEFVSSKGQNCTITKDKIVRSSIYIFKPDDKEYIVANYLYEKIKERNEDFNEPNLQAWAGHVDKLMRLTLKASKQSDEEKAKEICQIIKWCQLHHFWQSNILSTSKLREKYFQLRDQKRTDDAADKGSNSKTAINTEKYKQLIAES